MSPLFLSSCATYTTVKHNAGIDIVDAVAIDLHMAKEVGGYIGEEVRDALQKPASPKHIASPPLMCAAPLVQVCTQALGCWCEWAIFDISVKPLWNWDLSFLYRAWEGLTGGFCSCFGFKPFTLRINSGLGRRWYWGFDLPMKLKVKPETVSHQ